jgi:hypothetical protein
MIRESYGNDVDIITDEEDLSHKLSTNSTPEKRSPQQPIKNIKYDVRMIFSLFRIKWNELLLLLLFFFFLKV